MKKLLILVGILGMFASCTSEKECKETDLRSYQLIIEWNDGSRDTVITKSTKKPYLTMDGSGCISTLPCGGYWTAQYCNVRYFDIIK